MWCISGCLEVEGPITSPLLLQSQCFHTLKLGCAFAVILNGEVLLVLAVWDEDGSESFLDPGGVISPLESCCLRLSSWNGDKHTQF